MISPSFASTSPEIRQAKAPLRMLIVEDDPIASGIVKSVAESCGFVVQAIDTGEIFEATIDASPPDVIVLDIFVPGRDGFEILNLMVGRRLHDLPLFIMSGFGERYINSALRLARVYGLNVEGQIAKPLDIDLLTRIFQTLRPDR